MRTGRNPTLLATKADLCDLLVRSAAPFMPYDLPEPVAEALALTVRTHTEGEVRCSPDDFVVASGTLRMSISLDSALSTYFGGVTSP